MIHETWYLGCNSIKQILHIGGNVIYHISYRKHHLLLNVHCPYLNEAFQTFRTFGDNVYKWSPRFTHNETTHTPCNRVLQSMIPCPPPPA